MTRVTLAEATAAARGAGWARSSGQDAAARARALSGGVPTVPVAPTTVAVRGVRPVAVMASVP